MPRKLEEIPHGTVSGYNWHRCRCELCRAAWTEYRRPKVREYRERMLAEDPQGYKAKEAARQREYQARKKAERDAAR